MLLAESDPKVLFTKHAHMWFKPIITTDQKEYPHYKCPLYRTSERRGVLATTGHSSNFVITLRIPSDRPETHWTKRGVAGLLSLSDWEALLSHLRIRAEYGGLRRAAPSTAHSSFGAC
jgi:dynein heavy chain